MISRTADEATRTTGGAAVRRGNRPRPLAVLVAVCVAVLLSAVPGVAAAAPPGTVVPFVDCYQPNADGSATIVLGYTNPTSKTVTIPPGGRNRLYPATFDGPQPKKFSPGTQRGVFSIRGTKTDLLANPRWELDGNTADYRTSLSAPPCSPSTPLPALGNGAGFALVLVVGGAVGFFFVRRLRRTAVA